MPYSDPERRREYLKEYQRRNRERLNRGSRVRGRIWRATHKARLRQKYIDAYYGKISCSRLAGQLRSYGMNFEEFGSVLMAQDGVCAVCKRDDKRLCVDHNHVTGKVRGLLCDRCNGLVLVVLERYGHLLEPARAYLSLPTARTYA